MAAAKVVITYKRRRVLPEDFIPQGNDHPNIAQDPLVEVAITNASIVSVAEGNKAENPREDSEGPEGKRICIVSDQESSRAEEQNASMQENKVISNLHVVSEGAPGKVISEEAPEDRPFTNLNGEGMLYGVQEGSGSYANPSAIFDYKFVEVCPTISSLDSNIVLKPDLVSKEGNHSHQNITTIALEALEARSGFLIKGSTSHSRIYSMKRKLTSPVISFCRRSKKKNNDNAPEAQRENSLLPFVVNSTTSVIAHEVMCSENSSVQALENPSPLQKNNDNSLEAQRENSLLPVVVNSAASVAAHEAMSSKNSSVQALENQSPLQKIINSGNSYSSCQEEVIGKEANNTPACTSLVLEIGSFKQAEKELGSTSKDNPSTVEEVLPQDSGSNGSSLQTKIGGEFRETSIDTGNSLNDAKEGPSHELVLPIHSNSLKQVEKKYNWSTVEVLPQNSGSNGSSLQTNIGEEFRETLIGTGDSSNNAKEGPSHEPVLPTYESAAKKSQSSGDDGLNTVTGENLVSKDLFVPPPDSLVGVEYSTVLEPGQKVHHICNLSETKSGNPTVDLSEVSVMDKGLEPIQERIGEKHSKVARKLEISLSTKGAFGTKKPTSNFSEVSVMEKGQKPIHERNGEKHSSELEGKLEKCSLTEGVVAAKNNKGDLYEVSVTDKGLEPIQERIKENHSSQLARKLENCSSSKGLVGAKNITSMKSSPVLALRDKCLQLSPEGGKADGKSCEKVITRADSRGKSLRLLPNTSHDKAAKAKSSRFLPPSLPVEPMVDSHAGSSSKSQLLNLGIQSRALGQEGRRPKQVTTRADSGGKSLRMQPNTNHGKVTEAKSSRFLSLSLPVEPMTDSHAGSSSKPQMPNLGIQSGALGQERTHPEHVIACAGSLGKSLRMMPNTSHGKAAEANSSCFLPQSLPVDPIVNSHASSFSKPQLPNLDIQSRALGQEGMSPKQASALAWQRMVLNSIANRGRAVSGNTSNLVSRFDLPTAWSEDELDSLWIGVRRYGRGNWDAMLRDSRLHFISRRTPKDLAEQWDMEQTKLFVIPPFIPATSQVRPSTFLDNYKDSFQNPNKGKQNTTNNIQISLGDSSSQQRDNYGKRSIFNYVTTPSNLSRQLQNPVANTRTMYPLNSIHKTPMIEIHSTPAVGPSHSKNPTISTDGNLPHWLKEVVSLLPRPFPNTTLPAGTSSVHYGEMPWVTQPFLDPSGTHQESINKATIIPGLPQSYMLPSGSRTDRVNLPPPATGRDNAEHPEKQARNKGVIVINSDASSEETVSDDRGAKP